MCEIVRALIASGKLENVSDDITALNSDVVDHIDWLELKVFVFLIKG